MGEVPANAVTLTSRRTQKCPVRAVLTFEIPVSDPESDRLEPLTDGDIAAYLDGFEGVRAETRRHIERCSYCREFIRMLEATPQPEQRERRKEWRCVNSKTGE